MIAALGTLGAIAGALGLVGLAAVFVIWLWVGRAPRDRGAYLSDEWRAAHRARE